MVVCIPGIAIWNIGIKKSFVEGAIWLGLEGRGVLMDRWGFRGGARVLEWREPSVHFQYAHPAYVQEAVRFAWELGCCKRTDVMEMTGGGGKA